MILDVGIAVNNDEKKPNFGKPVAVFGLADTEDCQAAYDRGLPLEDLAEIIELSFKAAHQGQAGMCPPEQLMEVLAKGVLAQAYFKNGTTWLHELPVQIDTSKHLKRPGVA